MGGRRGSCVRLFFYAALIMTVLLTCYVGSVTSRDPMFPESKIQRLNQGWNEEDPSRLAFLPKLRDKGVVFSRKLPDRLEADDVLCVETKQQGLRAYVDGKLIYQRGVDENASFGKAAGLMWHIIELPQDLQGKEIFLLVTSPYEKLGNKLHGVSLGDKTAVTLSLVNRSMGVLIVCGFTLLAGIALLFLNIILALKKVDYTGRMFLYLGLFSIFSSVWAWTDSGLAQLLPIKGSVVYVLSFAMFMLLPVTFLLFFRETCEGGKKAVDILCLLHLVNFTVCMCVYATGVGDLARLAGVTHLLIVLTIIAVLRISIQESRKSPSVFGWEIVLGVCVLCAVTVLAVIWFYFDQFGGYAALYRWGLFFFTVLLGVGSLRKIVSLLSAQVEAQSYKKLAFVDVMTMTANRAAFERDMAEIESKGLACSSLSLILLDLDNLKKTNDTYGHLEGDRRIVGFANGLKEVFGESVYRIGGDEFTVILKDREEKAVEGLIDSLMDSLKNVTVAKEPLKGGALKFCWGYGRWDAGRDGECLNLERLFRTADNMLYRGKASRGR